MNFKCLATVFRFRFRFKRFRFRFKISALKCAYNSLIFVVEKVIF